MQGLTSSRKISRSAAANRAEGSLLRAGSEGLSLSLLSIRSHKHHLPSASPIDVQSTLHSRPTLLAHSTRPCPGDQPSSEVWGAQGWQCSSAESQEAQCTVCACSTNRSAERRPRAHSNPPCAGPWGFGQHNAQLRRAPARRQHPPRRRRRPRRPHDAGFPPAPRRPRFPCTVGPLTLPESHDGAARLHELPAVLHALRAAPKRSGEGGNSQLLGRFHPHGLLHPVRRSAPPGHLPPGGWAGSFVGKASEE